MTDLSIQWMPGRFAVCRLDPLVDLPDWVTESGSRSNLLSLTRTTTELSIVIDERQVPQGVVSESGWVAFQVVGTLDFSLTGILAGLATTLAEAGIPIFAISTYDTDVILVRDADRGRVETTLAARYQWVDP